MSKKRPETQEFYSRIPQNLRLPKFSVFALFYFVLKGNFPSTSPRGAYIWKGDLTKGFLGNRFGGLIHGGAYFRNFTVFMTKASKAWSVERI